MRRCYLVCYDIRDQKRLRRVHKIMKGFGEGIRSFKEGMSGTSHTPQAPPAQAPPSVPAQPGSEEKK